MIVKDEAHVIRRCLSHLRPFIDHWVIVDTGSSDETKEIIKQELADIPGTLHERPWQDFGHNRTEALELAAQSGCQYALIIDADEEFLPEPHFHWPEPMHADAYQVLQRTGKSDVIFYRTQVVRLALPWRYVGVLHEVLVCSQAAPAQTLDDLVIHGRFDSARNRDLNKKYARDAELLERALLTEPDNARYRFYLAQSYRDCGDLDAAELNYQARAEMGGWYEEVHHSLFQIGEMRVRLHRPEADIQEAFLAAYDYRPCRIEPLVSLARYYRVNERFARSYLYAKAALDEPVPDDILFVDTSAYRWRAADEYAIAAYWIGRYEECKRACERLLRDGALPFEHRERVEKNLAFANSKLRG